MGAIFSVGFAVCVKTVVLGHYKSKTNAQRRCDAERSVGIDAKVYEMWASSALGERE